jgi:uncharacterized membrane protein YjjP (DUF1212 family)
MNILHLVAVFAFLICFGISGFVEGRHRNTGEAGLWFFVGILLLTSFFYYTLPSPHRKIEYAVLSSTLFWISGFIEGRLRRIVPAGLIAVPTLIIAEILLVVW